MSLLKGKSAAHGYMFVVHCWALVGTVIEDVYSFGYWVMRRRKALDLTRAGLAQQVSCSPETIKKIERDERRPSPQMAELLATVLVVSGEARDRFLQAARGERPVDRLYLVDRPLPQKPRHNLPLQLSSFIGREREIAEVRRLLAASRLVTLTGAGGSGKTRLALQAAREVLDAFPDGIWLVELAPLTHPALAASFIASTLGLIEDKDRPPLDTLVDYLRDRQLLLLLDNCEHLIDTMARLVETLGHHCPNLHILTTSRERLEIDGEVVWPVPPLGLPTENEQLSFESLAGHDSIRLFVERASAALPAFRLTGQNAAAVAHLCRRLDGIPMAIELAAARVKLLRVEEIVARLDDRFQLLTGGNRTAPPRHQTLKALIDWSYNLLPPIEQRLLRRLAVFAGGFSLAEVEGIGDEENEGHVLDLLSRLVNKSLVVADRVSGREARYSLHEIIRQYAWAQLEEAGETTEFLERHAATYCRVLESTQPRFFIDDRIILHRDWLEAEMENLRAVMGRSLDDSAISAEWGIRVAVRLGGYWLVHSRLEEALRWLEAAVERVGGETLLVRAILYTELGLIAKRDFRPFDGDKVEEALAIFRQLSDGEGTIFATHLLAMNYWDPERAKMELEQIIPLAVEIGAESLSWVYFGLSWQAGLAQDYPQAIAWGEKNLKYLQDLAQSRIRLAGSLRMVAIYYRFAGDLERATTLIQESLEIARDLDIGGDFILETLNALGEAARYQADYDLADDYFRRALSMAGEMGHVSFKVMILSNMALCRIARGDVAGAKATYRQFLAVLRQGERLFQLFSNWDLWFLAQVAEMVGEPERAALLHGAAESTPVHLGRVTTIIGPADSENIAANVDRVRALMGDEAYAAAWIEGQRLSPDEVIAVVEELIADSGEKPD